MDSIKKKAYAKINLALRITGRREDGYHELDMLFLELDLFDEIEVRKIPEGIVLSCSDKTLPVNDDNLACRAARYMMEKYGIAEGVDITLAKNIPSQAGLGGGSSDAACVMRCMNGLFELGISDSELEKDAVSLGADVPFFIRGGLARARGIGDRLERLGSFPECSILLVKPEGSVSTPWAYKAFDAMGKSEAVMDIDEAVEAIRSGNISKLADCIGNDLEAPVIKELPVIARIKNRMLDGGAVAAMMTGSGSAVFGLFESKEKAAACAAAIGMRSFVTKSVDRI